MLAMEATNVARRKSRLTEKNKNKTSCMHSQCLKKFPKSCLNGSREGSTHNATSLCIAPQFLTACRDKYDPIPTTALAAAFTSTSEPAARPTTALATAITSAAFATPFAAAALAAPLSTAPISAAVATAALSAA